MRSDKVEVGRELYDVKPFVVMVNIMVLLTSALSV